MTTARKHKKNLIVSYKNLTDDLKEKFKEAYPEGYNNYLQKFVKPNGEAIYVVPFETEDTAYMVKFEVKIDTLGDDLDKALFDDDDVEAKEEEFAPLSEALEKEEENTSHNERVLKHGAYEEMMEEEKDRKKKLTLGINKEEFKEAFGDDEDVDEMDSYERLDDDEPADDDFEPSDEDLRDIEEEYLDAEIPPLDATIPEEEAVVIKPKAGEKPAKKAAAKSTVKVVKPAAKAVKPAVKVAAKAVKPVAKKAAPASKKAAPAPKKVVAVATTKKVAAAPKKTIKKK